MKNLFLILSILFFAVSCNTNQQNTPQSIESPKTTEKTQTQEIIWKNIPANTIYHTIQPRSTENLQISFLQLGSTGVWTTEGRDAPLSSYRMGSVLGISTNNIDAIQYAENTKNNEVSASQSQLFNAEVYNQDEQLSLKNPELFQAEKKENLFLYSLGSIFTQEYRANDWKNTKFYISPNNASWNENDMFSQQKTYIVDFSAVQPFFTNDVQLSATFPQYIDDTSVKYTTTDGKIHDIPKENIYEMLDENIAKNIPFWYCNQKNCSISFPAEIWKNVISVTAQEVAQ